MAMPSVQDLDAVRRAALVAFRPVELAAVSLDGRIEFRIQRKLRSPNEVLGRHWREKNRERKTWQAACENALVAALGVAQAQALLGPGAALVGCRGGCTVRRRVEVRRLTPKTRNFIRDDDNLRFAVKPVLDALTHLGLLKDDKREGCQLALPTQDVSSDQTFWTWIAIDTPVEEPAMP